MEFRTFILDRDLWCEAGSTRDVAEGAAAVLEKREPAFKGR